jgi:hypothetical protein
MYVHGISPKPYDTRKLRAVIEGALKKEGKRQKKVIAQTTKHWKGTKPKFEVLLEYDGDDAVLVIGPSGPEKGVWKWRWIDEGTRRHPIVARRAKRLAFRSGFRSGSTPGTLRTRASKSWGAWRRPVAVMHPGIKARNWSTTLMKQEYKNFREAMNKATKEGLKLSR